MKNRLFDVFMPLLPKNELSHWVGRAVHQPLPSFVGKKSVEWFAKYYRINMAEAEYPIDHYKTIGELFTRRLKPGMRPVGEGVVHPADSFISESGKIQDNTMIQAKGKTYTVPELLRSESYNNVFEGGSWLTYYLCPTDYHRVHSPVDGEIIFSCHVPGQLWPVNTWSVESISNLFGVNERIVLIIQTPKGRVALVMVAATNVGNMKMCFDESLNSTFRKGERQVKERSYQPPVKVKKGDEVGVFHMGSTVVMLYEKGMLDEATVNELKGRHVKMGRSL
jgi:phosphatidylserine decarboxylase